MSRAPGGPPREMPTPALSDMVFAARSLRWQPSAPVSIFKRPPGRPSGDAGVEGRAASAVAAELGLTPAGSLYVARSRVMARLRHEIDQIERGGERRVTAETRSSSPLRPKLPVLAPGIPRAAPLEFITAPLLPETRHVNLPPNGSPASLAGR